MKNKHKTISADNLSERFSLNTDKVVGDFIRKKSAKKGWKEAFYLRDLVIQDMRKEEETIDAQS